MSNDYVYEVARQLIEANEDVDTIVEECRDILMDDVREVLRDIRIMAESELA